MPKKKKKGPVPAAQQKKRTHIDRRTLLVRVVAIALAVLMAGSALSILFFS